MVAFSNFEYGCVDTTPQGYLNQVEDDTAMVDASDGEGFCDRMINGAVELGRVVFGYPNNPSLLITSQPCQTHFLDCPADLQED